MSFTPTEPLRPQLFLTREDGTMVPLIAMDELPSIISIRGVPRSLSPHDIAGMTGVGTFNARPGQYVIDSLNREYETPLLSAEKSLMGYSIAMPTMRPLRNDSPWAMSRGKVFATPPKAFGIQEQPPSNPKTPFANMAPSTPEPSIAASGYDLPAFHDLDELPVGRAPGIKEYCSFWLRNGECDYAQQGCLYRHEMPLDRSTLEKLGLRDIPRWYREKHRLGSYLAGGSTKSGINVSIPNKPALMERNWRSPATEVSVDASGRKSQKEVERPTVLESSAIVQRNPKSSMSQTPPTTHNAPTNPAASYDESQDMEPEPTPTFHAIFSSSSRHQPWLATTRVREEDTVVARQNRETLRQLDAIEKRERDRIAEKYQTLQPQKATATTGIAVPANTPSTSTASSTSGGPEGEETVVVEEAAVPAKDASKSMAAVSPSASTSTASPPPKQPSPRQTPTPKKKAGRPKGSSKASRRETDFEEGR